MHSLRLVYERQGVGTAGGDMIRFVNVPYRLKVYEYTTDEGAAIQNGVAYLDATEETLQFLSMDTNLTLQLEDGERFSFEFSGLAFGKITIRLK